MPKPDRFAPEPIDNTQAHALKVAWQSIENGTTDRKQGALVLKHLADLTGYYYGSSLVGWISATGSPAGYETACVEYQARRYVFAEILKYLTVHPDGRGTI